MKLSKGTLDILKNFATINTNILIREGNTLSTISTGKNIFARAEVTEAFPREFAIYDLNGLLPLLTLMEDTDVDFGDENSFREKLDTLKESYFPKAQPSSSSEETFGDEDGSTAQDVDTTDAMKTYMSAISRNQKASA